MTTQQEALQRLVAFLNELFQFDTQDLDFGIYKILHHKRHEIRRFVEHDLVQRIEQELLLLQDEELQNARIRTRDLEQKETIKKWQKAVQAKDETRRAIYEEDFPTDIVEYRDLKKFLAQHDDALAATGIVYDNLYKFFSRYYDKGDFVSRRRFSKKGKYVVPYNGEETLFHWANKDQYYIKSSEHFQNYAFVLPHHAGTRTVRFKLAAAHTPQGNVKAAEARYFVLAAEPPAAQGDDLHIHFEFRPLNDGEKETLNGGDKQGALNEAAYQSLHEKLAADPKAAGLWKSENPDAPPLLLRKIHHFTRKNQYDFFIHKNLRDFLSDELNFFIQSEMLRIEDLYVSESDLHFDSVRNSFRTIKAFKNIADTIIELLAQIEEFQKKLWEKKKFVLSTHYVVTLDKLVGWIGEEAARPFLLAALQNPAQLREWQELFGPDALPRWENPAPDDLHTTEQVRSLDFEGQNGQKNWRKLPIDTAHFPPTFREHLLEALSEAIDLDDASDGTLLHSDNFHALRLLQNKFKEQIKCVYIDPPYNTAASEILYKNEYKNSSWMALVENRLALTGDLLTEEGILCATIDDCQQKELHTLLEMHFSDSGLAGTVAIRCNPSGRPTQTGFALAHEYAIFARKTERGVIERLERTETQAARFDQTDEIGIFEWRNLRREGSDSDRDSRRSLFYPIYYDASIDKIRVPNMIWKEEAEIWVELEEPNSKEVVILPIDDKDIERRWRWSHEKVLSDPTQVVVKKVKGKLGVYCKYRPNGDGAVTPTLWTDPKYSATEHGTALLKKLFPTAVFSYPKSVYAVEDCLAIMGMKKPEGIVLDYFAGSGTTWHATQLLNRDDGGSRKCLLAEQGGYAYTVILPRIKKLAYTFDWKEGRPRDGSMNGLGVFMKYQRLEQYEEALENIAFEALPDPTRQMLLEFGDYIPKYFLQLETRGSRTLVNTEAMRNPWDYRLRTWDGFTYDTELAADLEETFLYLAGLHLQKCHTRTLANDRRYRFLLARDNSGRRALAVWRDTTGWTEADYVADRDLLEAELARYAFDDLYVNDDALLLRPYRRIEQVFLENMLT